MAVQLVEEIPGAETTLRNPWLFSWSRNYGSQRVLSVCTKTHQEARNGSPLFHVRFVTDQTVTVSGVAMKG